MPVLVVRCEEGPAAVPSRKVTCSGCGQDCWLSLKSGDDTVELARQLGSPEIMCMECLEDA